MTPRLKHFAAEQTPYIMAELKSFFAEKKEMAESTSPHLLHSFEVIEEFVFRGGKAVRPLLVILAYRLAGGSDEAIYRAAAAVEMFHKYILNIDDIADRDESRYGGPTLWNVHQKELADWRDAEHQGRTYAEIDSVLMTAFTTELMRTAHFPAERTAAALGVINQKMYIETVAGWQIHYVQNHQPLADATEAEYQKGVDLVTAQYTFVAPLEVGAVLAGWKTDSPEFAPFLEYGQHVGRAFQLQDDILGLFGDTEETGKPVGNDLREGKKTLLLQRAYRSASAEDQAFLRDVCGRELQPGELERTRAVITQTGSLKYSQQTAQELVDKGVAALKKYSGDQNAEEIVLLKELAEYVVQRKK